METFAALLAICAGNSPVTGEFYAQRPVTRSFDVFFDLHLHERLRKQSWGWWFETLPRPLCRHSNVTVTSQANTLASKKTSQIHILTLCGWDPTVPDGFSSQRANNTESFCELKYHQLGIFTGATSTQSWSVVSTVWFTKSYIHCNRDMLLHVSHYSNVIMSEMASQIISRTSIYSTVYSGRSTKTSKLRVTGLCAGNLPVTGEFPAQRASNAENLMTSSLLIPRKIQQHPSTFIAVVK